MLEQVILKGDRHREVLDVIEFHAQANESSAAWSMSRMLKSSPEYRKALAKMPRADNMSHPGGQTAT